jgi:putative addiction module CopG family antidote
MRTTHQFNITLPDDMAEAVKSKVATGEYATESEVLRDGLRILMARDRAAENWLKDEVATAHDALKSNPSRALTAQQVRATISAQQRSTINKCKRRQIRVFQ